MYQNLGTMGFCLQRQAFIIIIFSIAASRTGSTVSKLKRRFRALLISLTPLSLVFAVENKDDLEKVKGYFNTVIKDKSGKEGGLWKEYYEARKWLK